MTEKIYCIPFIYQRYGRISVTAKDKEEAYEKAEETLQEMSVQKMDELSEYLQDSEELDMDGLILDGDGNVIEEIKLPDSSITIEEMHAYGYHHEEMLPLRGEQAEFLFLDNNELFLLFPDNTENLVWELDDIYMHVEHGGIFGIEKKAWNRRLENESSQH